MAILSERLLLAALLALPSVGALGCGAAAEVPDSGTAVPDTAGAGPGEEADTGPGEEADTGTGEAAAADVVQDERPMSDTESADPQGDAVGPSDEVTPTDLCEGVVCDDDLDCTADACDPATGACSWVLEDGQCFVGGACYADGVAHPQDGCRVCDSGLDMTGWSPLDEGATCDDLDSCTSADVCQAGTCTGEVTPCSDGNLCTTDGCDPLTGCIFLPVDDGLSCDDEAFCTVGEVCTAGNCGDGEPRLCDDGDPCTDEVCDGDACVPSFNQAACDDGDPCTSGEYCTGGSCDDGAATDCDDSDVCTIDLCDEEVGCVHLPTLNACCTGDGVGCDDANPCTTASCDEATGECIQTPNTAACDDGDACTVGDACSDLSCGGVALECDDENPCTDDVCSPLDGCIYVPGVAQEGAACDDGQECTTGDVCAAGECVGDASGCQCTPVFGDAVRATFIEMGTTGFPGDGLNLDEDSSTCSPEGDCSDGIDNSLAILAGLANESIADAVASGELNFLIELRETSPGVHLLSAFTAELAPNNPECDLATETCEWWVDQSFLDEETCLPITALDATLDGNSVVGGGVGSILPFALPLGDSSLMVTLLNLQFKGELTYTDGQVSSFSGVFGGAVPKSALEAAVNSVPDEDLPLPKTAILGFMGLLENDIDTNGDGMKDALSLGLKVSGIDAVLTGSQ
jgi:hypothetical protein